ncbi:hypothetical protein [Mangrovicoccus sp. HB161399]|uniref:hypothetical protein n=1 Tax=Mangrovicoccus sp. HB161399 TaxID=2720392 RepID=UPI0015534E35|nr:hypothetical protein [Mangrovicoccus sp. HB161399]
MDVLSALAASGIACSFVTASVDGRNPFDSRLDLELTAAAVDGFALMRSDSERDAPFRIERRGVWTSFSSDEIFEFGRNAIIDIGPDGKAVMVVNQPEMAAQVLSREGRCRPAEAR